MNNILITGTSSGVGKALAIYLSKRFNVIALSRRKEQMLNNFQGFDNIDSYEIDIVDSKMLDITLEMIKNKHGEISYIINNAGILINKKLTELDFKKSLDYSLKLNALAPLQIINFFLADMKKNNFGRIINLTSGAPLNCFPSFGAYSSSKAVLNSLTVTLAKELEEYNIKINLMSPGPVKSEMAPDAPMEVAVCFDTVDYLLDLKENGSSGEFFWLGYKVPLFPDLKGVKWLEGIGNEKLERVL